MYYFRTIPFIKKWFQIGKVLRPKFGTFCSIFVKGLSMEGKIQ